MTRKNGPWTIEDSVCKYRGELIEVYEDRVINPVGKPATYATVRTTPGVAILPVDKDGTVYLTKQFRYAVGRPSIEAASGAIEDDESAEAAARRELCEELGIEAGEWVDLGVIYNNTSIMKDQSHLFLAFDLTFTEPQREGSEKGMTTIRLGLDEAVSLILRNEIFSSVACTLVLKAKEHISRNENRG